MRVGTVLGQKKDFSVTWTREDFTKNVEQGGLFSVTLTREGPKFPPASPELWAGRKGPLSSDETKMRQCTSGELRRAATVSRPDICARLARVALRINSLCESDAHRINDLARLAKEWREATELKYASSSRPWRTRGGVGKAEDGLFNGGEKMHCRSTALLGWSDAAYGGQWTEG